MSKKSPILIAVMNIVEPKLGIYTIYFKRWIHYVSKINHIKNTRCRLLLTPISEYGPTRRDYEEQMDRIYHGLPHVWDDSKHNNSKSGDLFGYVWNQKKLYDENKSLGLIKLYRITDIYSPKYRLPTWSSNVGQGDRNVIELSPYCIYTGSLEEFKKLVGYKEKWNCQGTMQVSESKTNNYLRNIY